MIAAPSFRPGQRFSFFFITAFLITFGNLPAYANLARLRDWKSQATSEVFQAPAPPNAEAQAEKFRNRNSGENIKQLAERFFNVVDLSRVPVTVKEKYLKADYQGALEAYRDFFCERLRFPPPGYPYGYSTCLGGYDVMRPAVRPGTRLALEYLASADELMSNIVVFAMKDPQGKPINLRVNIGPPGRINWTWQPSGYTNAGWPGLPVEEGLFNAVLGTYVDSFNTLLVKYLETRDPRYLEKWQELADDRCMNWASSTLAAGQKVRMSWAPVGTYAEALWPNFAYLTRTVPEFDRQLSSPTLARLILNMFEVFMAPPLRGARMNGGNRRMGQYGYHLLLASQAFPELKCGQYCLREWRRLLEIYMSVVSRPDGTDPGEMVRNYLFTNPAFAGTGWRFLISQWFECDRLHAGKPWVSAEWTQEFMDYMTVRARYMIHHPNNAGGITFYGDYLSMRGGGPYDAGGIEYARILTPIVPQVLVEPDCAKILSTLYGGGYYFPDNSKGQPSFSSEAMPFGGFYTLRTGYGKEDHYLFTYSALAPWSGGDWIGNGGGVVIQAFGRDLLKTHFGPALAVDGADCKVDSTGLHRAEHPEVYLKWVAKINGKIAPLPHRWHTSDYFDLCETTYDFPFDNAAYNGKPRGGDKPLWIDDVVHRRQIIFVRQAGLYVVTDRMFSTNRHNYAIRWAFAATAKELPAPLLKGSYGYTNYGFTRAQVTIDPARNAIRTAAPSTANLSIYHFCPQPLKTWPDEGSVFPYLETKCGFEGTGDQIMTSVLYPRSKPENELGSIEALPAGKDITGWKATLPDGTKISYCGAVKEATLNVDDVEIKGQALLVMTTKDGKRSGLALDCSEFKTGWRKSSVPCADFEFDLSSSKPSAFSLLSSVISRQSSAISFIPIYRPLGLVEISPAADCFVDRLEVTMSHPEPDVDIRYTLDGTDPTGASALYQKPVILERNTIVKARAFRKGVTEVPPTFSGTHVSAVMRANYTRDTLWPARKVETTRGFAAAYYEGDFALSLMTLEALRPIKEVAVPGLFDLGQKHTSNNFAFVYSGYLDIPSDGVYNFHAPPELIYPYLDAGYDLRVFVDGKEWYPATRLHNFGAWSVPLAKGKHSFKVSWVDQRPGHAQWAYPDGEVLEKFTIWRGEKPTLEISGPGLAKQPIPVEMLSY